MSFDQLLSCSLPVLTHSKAKTESKSGTVPTYPTECGVEFKKWSSFDTMVEQFCRYKLQNVVGEFQKQTFLQDGCRNEMGVQVSVFINIGKTLSNLLGAIGIPAHFSFPQGDNQVAFNPDIVCKILKENDEKLAVVIEVKPWWAFPMHDDAPNEYWEDIGRSNNESILVRGIQQIYGYMSFNYLRYGILTTYHGAYFLKRVNQSTLLISAAKYINDPDYLKYWMYLIAEADAEGCYSSPTGDPFARKSLVPIKSADRYTLSPINSLQIQFSDLINMKKGVDNGALGTVFGGNLESQEDIKFKMVDSFNTAGALQLCETEVMFYKQLEELQGSVIPKFYGYFNLHGFLILALQDCGSPINQTEFFSLKTKIDKAVKKLDEFGVDQNDLECRDGVYPNILCKDGEVRIIDFHVAKFASNKRKALHP